MSSQPNPLILANPMLSINYRIWVAMGYLCQRDSRKYFTLVPSVILFVLQISYLIFSGDELDMISIYGYFAALHFNCMFRVFYTIKFRARFEKYLDDFCTLYEGVLDAGDKTNIQIIDDVSARAKRFTKANLVCGFISVICQAMFPQILGGRIHPYGLYVKNVNFKASPLYELAYGYELVFASAAVLYYIPFCNLFASSIFFGIALLEILKENFRNIALPFDVNDLESQPNNALIEKKFRLFIEYHKRLIRYVDELNEIVSTACLVEIIIFGALLCVLLFVVLIVDKTLVQVLGVIYIGLILFQLLAIYWLSNELITQSADLLPAIYDCPWYCLNLRNQKTILIIMGRIQAPMEIMVGNIAPITLQTFQSILNMSYTYFTLLRGSVIK